jgi:hypothetical protein
MIWDRLPDEVLQLVFQWLSTQQCLQGVALVCQRFWRIANATNSIAVIAVTLTDSRRDKLKDWLHTYGWSVRSLKAAAAAGTERHALRGMRFQLDMGELLQSVFYLPELDSLKLTKFEVPILPGCSGLAAATQLTALELEDCTLGHRFEALGLPAGLRNTWEPPGSAIYLHGLAALTNLQSLKLPGFVVPAILPEKLTLLTELEV